MQHRSEGSSATDAYTQPVLHFILGIGQFADDKAEHPSLEYVF